MNEKQAKKLRKLYRQDSNEIVKRLIEVKPRFLPNFIWQLIIKAVLK